MLYTDLACILQVYGLACMTCSGPAEYEWPEEGRESLFQDEHLCSPGKRSKHTIHEVLLCMRSKIKEQC